MRHTFKEMANAARRLHWNYGAGDVLSVRVYADGRIELCAKATSARCKIFKGRVVGNSVRLHGHQCRMGFDFNSNS